MSIDIQMPALSPTMEEGTLSKWLVKVGDTISSGDILAEIETDKATMEVESIDEGVVGKILIDEGTQNVKVGAVILQLLEDGETEADLGAPASAPAAVEAAPVAAPAAAPAAAPVAASAPADFAGIWRQARCRYAHHRARLCRYRCRRGYGRSAPDRRIHDMELCHASD